MKTLKGTIASLGSLLLLIVVTSCSKEETTTTENELELVSVKAKKETLESQLKKVNRATMRYHSFEQAKKAGYADPYPFNPSIYVPNMGFHYINVGLIDGEFDMEKPEILLYVPNEQGQLKLVGVEYAVPKAISPTPPEGFVGDADHWDDNPNVAGGSWTLHAWIVEENPNGVFAEFNPNVPFSDPSDN
ncbi:MULTISPECIES: hypothetical protein [Maribacter]|uniref:Uncharacterized protein n=2 Tax=Maribacter TaxID=252356 RepID=A0A5R8M3P6_9FLAO|nr:MULTISPECIES: hypothetical protein [Maribacter]MDC6404729.1 hypothetical protein [Maribacter sp. PR66]MEE1972143.1 hypothetical protein [Maribacter flavus]TLF44242.1 hypothetical protein FEK29_12470 [Maribacter aurantiacus]